MKRVVVIGGGFAGALIARALQRDFAVTLIDSKDYFEFTPGVLRCLVEPEHLCKIQALHKDYLVHGEFLQGHVSAVTPDSVVADGKKIAYDYLVLSSGSRYSMPFKEGDVVLATRGKDFAGYAEQLQKADKIL